MHIDAEWVEHSHAYSCKMGERVIVGNEQFKGTSAENIDATNNIHVGKRILWRTCG